ncbi:MAG: hypothetical protein H0X36_10745 [Sphingomonadaceae bacterium]|nr:hypothetical protein [Sphingomonadaceae bacterium]
MRALLAIVLVVVIGLIAAVAFGLIDVNKTQEGKLPEVRAEGGQLPGYDVKTGEVQVGTTNTTVEVPKVGTETKTIAVPTVAVKKAH